MMSPQQLTLTLWDALQDATSTTRIEVRENYHNPDYDRYVKSFCLIAKIEIGLSYEEIALAVNRSKTGVFNIINSPRFTKPEQNVYDLVLKKFNFLRELTTTDIYEHKKKLVNYKKYYYKDKAHYRVNTYKKKNNGLRRKDK